METLFGNITDYLEYDYLETWRLYCSVLEVHVEQIRWNGQFHSYDGDVKEGADATVTRAGQANLAILNYEPERQFYEFGICTCVARIGHVVASRVPPLANVVTLVELHSLYVSGKIGSVRSALLTPELPYP